MKPSDLTPFFEDVGEALAKPVRIILTGGVVVGLYANERFTQDLDFSLQERKVKDFEAAEAVLRDCARRHDLQLQYSEDIERWGSLSFLDWRKKTRTVGRYGKLTVDALEPLYFSLGKISRATDQDLEDLDAVFKAEKVKGAEVASLWAKALKASSPSSDLANVKRQMEHYLKTRSASLWSKSVDLEAEFTRLSE